MSVQIAVPARVEAQASTTVKALVAMMLGIFLVGTAGFSSIQAVHNAAHDTRHSSAFPCH